MIEVVYKREGGVLSLSLDGHAGAAEFGQDIVCAAASMLAYTLAAAVAEAEDKLRNEPVVSLTSGRARVICAPFPEEYERIRSLYEFTVRGYRLLAEKNPAYVTLISCPRERA